MTLSLSPSLIQLQLPYSNCIMHSNQWLAPKEPVWILKNGQFLRAIVESLNNDIVICMLEDGNYAQAKKNVLFQRNPAYKEFNPERWDLMDTDLLNQPEVLKTLKLRLENSRIYTFVQNSVISVNPYSPIPTLYLDELKQFYIENLIHHQDDIRDYEPHIYSIAAKMLAELQRTKVDQAVIISGESGAGKTEANKELLRFMQLYFQRYQAGMDQNIDNVLSLSNPILQAFGNSKTIRNNNSSRFGKYLALSLNSKLEIKNVRIFNYLLEKSRIISRSQDEQNFHIFYELLKGLTKQQKMKYYLCSTQGKQLKMEDFNYLRTKNPSQYEQHPDISFQKVKRSLITLEKQDTYDFVCRVLAAVLLLGNLTPYQSQNEDCCKISNELVLDHVCELLRIKKTTLSNALTCYPIKIGSQILTKYFNAREVQELINSLAKILYEKLFQWIINQINSMSVPETGEKMLNLGFLDIYGFEILEQNSLEQLFINYTNQRLHQIYLNKIFKEEELLFKKEGLSNKFKNIPFEDNAILLQLMDYEQLSIFNLLDQWCSVASPDDSNFITKLRHKHKKHPKFPTSNFNLPSTMFLIRHSPKDIEYTVMGFREKNRDLVREELKAAARSSALPHLAAMFTDSPETSDSSKQNHKFRKFLSSKFRHQINNLVTDLIGKSHLHFIRCIKSNSKKAPLLMEDEVAYNQICYLGILDTIKLKKIGYCVKLTYDTIDKRFQWLVRYYPMLEAFPKEIKQKIKSFLPRFGEDDILYGNTMVFFKDYAFTTFNKKYALYLEDLNRKCKMVQKNITAFLFARKRLKYKKSSKTIRNYLLSMLTVNKYDKTMRGVMAIQHHVRAKLNLLRKMKRMKNILIVQAYIKKTVCRRNKQKVFRAVEMIVNLIRRYKLRKNIRKLAVVNKMKEYLIQRAWRKISLARKNVIEKYLHGFIIQLGEKSLINVANYNTHKKFQQKSNKALENYIKGYAKAVIFQKYVNKVSYLQRFFQSWLCHQRLKKLRRAAITIQRAYRQYYFNKNTARQIYQQNFGGYQTDVNNENIFIRSFLYQNSMQNSLRLLYHTFLNKYRDKCQIFYVVLDFETFVDMELCYPNNSWLLNYFNVVKQTLEKDNPIQSLTVGETFTVAASTNRLYVWGMNRQYKTYENSVMLKPQPNTRFDKVTVIDNQLKVVYEQKEKSKQKMKDQQLKSDCTIGKQYVIENGKLFESKNHVLKLIKMPQQTERVLEVACGANHTILRTSAKKVYTFGFGKYGQLGHNNFQNVDQPKTIDFPQFKNYQPLQISASYNCCVLLLSNKKMYWWGSNGTIEKVKIPTLVDISQKVPPELIQFQQFGSAVFSPLKIQCSWSKSLSVIGVSFLHFNGKLASNISLRGRVHDIIISKWQEQDIHSINPPFYTAYTDYLQECHVKLPRSKVTIQPQSKRNLKKIEDKVSSIQTDRYANEFSFSNNPK